MLAARQAVHQQCCGVCVVCAVRYVQYGQNWCAPRATAMPGIQFIHHAFGSEADVTAAAARKWGVSSVYNGRCGMG